MSFLDFPPKKDDNEKLLNPSTIAPSEDPLNESQTVSERMRDMEKLAGKTKQNEIQYFSSNQAKGSILPVTQQDELDKQQKKKKIIIIALIIAVGILILGLGLGLGLKGKNNDNPYVPPPPPPPPHTNKENAFFVNATTTATTGPQIYILQRDPLADPPTLDASRVNVTSSNKYVDQIVFKASLAQQGSVRMQFGDFSDSAAQTAYSARLNDLFGPSNLKGEELSVNQVGFDVTTNSPLTESAEAGENVAFSWRIYDKVTQKEYINTINHPFYAMTHYIQLGFTLNCNYLFGLGDRNSEMFLKDGLYTLYPKVNNMTDDGTSGNQGFGYHPFMMCIQPADRTFMGVFILNSNPMDVMLNTTADQKKDITVRTIGGIIDLFVFQGPSYNDVVRQYQQVIGKPKLPPYWAHGYHSRSRAYTNIDSISKILKDYEVTKLPIESIGLPEDAMVDMKNMNFNIDFNAIIKDYPFINFILPFTYFVPNTQTDMINQLTTLGALVTANNKILGVTFAGKQGVCIDFFPLASSTYVKDTLIQGQFDSTVSGLWLNNNMPFISANDADATNNPFSELTYIPGSQPLGTDTVPIFAEHKGYADGQTISHLEAHSMYGTVMTRSIQSVASNLASNHPAFIISDSTYPGAGQLGVSHVFPRNNGSWEDLQQSFTNMLLFNIYGIPNNGPNLCGFYPVEDKELCVRYYQLSVVSPIAMHNQDTFNVVIDGILNDILPPVLDALNKRLTFLVYMRTSLYKIFQEGGTLLRPVIADTPHDDSLYSTIGDSVMFGDNIRVEFGMKAGQTEKVVYFPSNEWLDLSNFQVLKTSSVTANIQNIDVTYTNSVHMYQKGNGTVVPLQNITRHSINNTDSAFSSPLVLSVYLDNQLSSEAQGFVQQDTLSTFTTATSSYRYFEVRARNGVISFAKQNKGTIEQRMELEKIILTNTQGSINAACALANDYWTTIPLRVSSWDPVNKQVNITTYDENDVNDKKTIDIGAIAYIFYGSLPQGVNCSQSLFNMKIEQVYQKDNKTYFAKISQSMKQLLGNVAFDVYLNITLLTDSSIYMHYGVTKYPKYNTPTEVYDRNFTQQNAMTKTVQLSDVLTISDPSKPFYFEIHSKADPEGKIPIVTYFSSLQSNNLFHFDFNIYSISHPQAKDYSDQFFGLGERTGDFFLKSGNVYSINSNDNNVADQPQSTLGANVKTVFGKNGFYPVVFGKTGDGTQLTAMWTISSTPQEYVYRSQSSQGTTPQITIRQAQTTLEQVLIFGLNPVDTSEALFNHVKFGSLYNKPQPYILPPPEWSFGQFFTMNGIYDNATFDQKYSYFQSLGYPIEGYVMDEENLDTYDSFTFNKNYTVNNTNWFLQELSLRSAAIIQISKSGFPILKGNPYTEQIKKYDMTILKAHSLDFIDVTNECVVGKDERGDVIYVDYSHPQSLDLIKQMMYNFALSIQIEDKPVKIGLQLIDNEITNKFCNGDCYSDNQLTVNKGSLFVAGNDKFMSGSLPLGATRVVGSELNLHNLNGLIEQLQYSNAPYYRYSNTPVFSDSTAIGSGSLGFVGRLVNWEDLMTPEDPLGLSAIQRMSVMGMQMIGLRIQISATDSPLAAMRKLYLSTFTPFSVLDIPEKLSANPDQKSMIIRKLRYMLIKYTRTQLFLSINTGAPMMRPFYFNEPASADAKNSITTQYNYGEDVLVSLTEGGANTYFPKGMYYTPSYLYYHFKFAEVFYSEGQVIKEPKFNAYMRDESVIAMQDPFGDLQGDKMVNTTDDLQNLPLDLHILYDFNSSTDTIATGKLLVEGPNNIDKANFCITMFTVSNATQILTASTTGSLEPTSKPEDTCKFNGFYLGQVIVYNQNQLNYDSLIVNTKDSVTAIPVTGANYVVFDLTGLKLHVIDLVTLAFHKKQ